jgi:hypothetical protein
MLFDLVRVLDFVEAVSRIHEHGGGRGCVTVALIFFAMVAGLVFVLFAPTAMTNWPLA